MQDTGLQVMAMLLVIGAALALQLWCQPYRVPYASLHHLHAAGSSAQQHHHMNMLEAATLCALIATLYLGLYNVVVPNRAGAGTILTALAIAINATMMAVLAAMFAHAYMTRYLLQLGIYDLNDALSSDQSRSDLLIELRANLGAFAFLATPIMHALAAVNYVQSFFRLRRRHDE